MEKNSIAKAFDSLFETYKRDDLQVRNILASKEFENYCKLLRKKSPQMDENEILTCIKVLSRLKVKSNNKLMQQLLHLLKDNINNLSLSQLAFFNLLLSNMDPPMPLTEALKMAIPLIFNLHIAEQIDHENPEEVQKIFHHVTMTEMKIGTPALMNIISSLALHGTSLSVDTTISVLMSTTRLPMHMLQDPATIKLIKNCFTTLNSSQTVFTDRNLVGSLIYRIITIYKQSKFQMHEFYNEKFYNKVAEFTISDDLGFNKAFSLLTAFNDITFVNYQLLDYIDRKIVQNDSILKNLELGRLRDLIEGFCNANYRTENWEILKTILHENKALHGEDLPVFIPVLKLTSNLLSLGFVSRILLQRVLNPEYLSEHIRFFAKTNNSSPLSYLRAISQTIHLLYPEHEDLLPPKIFMDIAFDKLPETVDENHRDVLEYIFGRHAVLTNLRTSFGHRLDFVINFDASGQPIELSKKIRNFEELPTHKVHPVAVMFQSKNHCPINFPYKLKGSHDLRRRTLEQAGVKEAAISTAALTLLNDNEKCAFIEREIKYLLK